VEVVEKPKIKRNRPSGLRYKPFTNTGYKGVSEITNPSALNKFAAQISAKNAGGKLTTIHIGHYATAEEAHYARLKFISNLF
jgi:hypothetical protein